MWDSDIFGVQNPANDEIGEFLPKEILVTKEEMSKLLEPITSKLGINLKLVKRLIAIEEAKHSMFDFLLSMERYKSY